MLQHNGLHKLKYFVVWIYFSEYLWWSNSLKRDCNLAQFGYLFVSIAEGAMQMKKKAILIEFKPSPFSEELPESLTSGFSRPTARPFERRFSEDR